MPGNKREGARRSGVHGRSESLPLGDKPFSICCPCVNTEKSCPAYKDAMSVCPSSYHLSNIYLSSINLPSFIYPSIHPSNSINHLSICHLSIWFLSSEKGGQLAPADQDLGLKPNALRPRQRPSSAEEGWLDRRTSTEQPRHFPSGLRCLWC